MGSTYNASQCGTLTGFNVSDRDRSDRLNSVTMIGTKGSCKIGIGTFIRAINAGSPSDFIVYGEMFGVSVGSASWPYW